MGRNQASDGLQKISPVTLTNNNKLQLINKIK